MINLIHNDFDKIVISPTIFPDKTSQVWQLPLQISPGDKCKIVWHYSNEAEVMHVAQLVMLVNTLTQRNVDLHMPYLPYGRQDKDISNDSTFALKTFVRLMSALPLGIISTVDAHPKLLPPYWINLPPLMLDEVIRETCPTLILYPDESASHRYANMFKSIAALPQYFATKHRNPHNGRVTQDVPRIPKGERVLVVDDICDGGASFVQLGRHLTNISKNVDMFVTHGIFSRGKAVLFGAGYDNVFQQHLIGASREN